MDLLTNNFDADETHSILYVSSGSKLFDSLDYKFYKRIRGCVSYKTTHWPLDDDGD